MLDIFYVNELFVAVPERWDSNGKPMLHVMGKLYDPHPDADAWIAATEEARVALRAAADAKLAAVRKERARNGSVSREDYLARKREDMRRWRYNNGDVHRARCKAWQMANPLAGRKYMKAYRTKVLADPVRAEAYRTKERERIRNLRARKKEAK